MIQHEPYNVGRAIELVVLAGLKPGESAIDDLKKGAWYIAREIERLEKMEAEKKPAESGAPELPCAICGGPYGHFGMLGQDHPYTEKKP